MKTNKNRNKKIIAGLLAFVIIGFLLVMANGLVGNPISKILANRAAEKHVEENYSDLNLEVEEADYNFKDGNYIVKARSNTSIDTYFEMNFTGLGKLHYDNYQDAVLDGWNTRMRLENEYRKLTDEVFKGNFPYESKIAYGGLIDTSSNFKHLELDKIYDIKEMGRKEGKLVIYIETEKRDKENLAKIVLDIKRIFDDEDIPFYSIDLTLEEARIEDGSEEILEEGLMIMDFLYKDISLEGLEKRVEENIKDTKKIFEEEDKKTKEIKEYEQDKESDQEKK